MTYEFFASCLAGLEQALADELKTFGIERVRPLGGGVAFFCEPPEAYRACLWSRLASRIALVLGRVNAGDADLLLLPGGMPGASNLAAHEGVCQALLDQAAAGRRIAAICAAPAVVLGGLGLLRGRRATCYPGFEQMLDGATYTADLCTVDGTITTGEGPAAAFPFAYELLGQLVNPAIAAQVAEGMRFKHLMSK